MKPPAGMVFIYGLYAEDEGLRYIGVTKCTLQKRLREHRFDAKHDDTRKARWMRKVLSSGDAVGIRHIATVPEADWPQWERDLIRRAKEIGVRLTNTCEGGIGLLNLPAESRARTAAFWRGRKHTPETIAKISAAKKNPSAETRAKISEAAKRQHAEGRVVAPWKGKHLSAEHKTKIGEAHRGHLVSAQTREKISTATSKNWQENYERRKAITSAARKGKRATEETRQKLIAAWMRRKARMQNVILQQA